MFFAAVFGHMKSGKKRNPNKKWVLYDTVSAAPHILGEPVDIG